MFILRFLYRCALLAALGLVLFSGSWAVTVLWSLVMGYSLWLSRRQLWHRWRFLWSLVPTGPIGRYSRLRGETL